MQEVAKELTTTWRLGSQWCSAVHFPKAFEDSKENLTLLRSPPSRVMTRLSQSRGSLTVEEQKPFEERADKAKAFVWPRNEASF